MPLFYYIMKTKSLLFLKKILESITTRLATIIKDIDQYLYFDKLELRDTDIYIVTFLKSGTTWMQMILYQMLTDGKLNFDHIYDVSPWLTNESISNKDPERVNKLPNPRIFKSHDPYKKFDSSAKNKIIYVYRNPIDTAYSLYNHRKNYNNPEETIEQTLKQYFSEKEEYNWFTYTKTWLENKHGLNIYYVKYEDLKNNFDATVQNIAQFLQVNLNEETLQRIKERSSFAFMKQHEEKFGEQPKDKRVYNQFIRKGEIGEGKKEIPASEIEQINATFNALIGKYEKVLNNR